MMAMQFDLIRAKLAKLSERDWPREWNAQAQQQVGDYYGWCHKYRLDPPLPEAEVAAFEDSHGVSLPTDYRAFLCELANGGAGPGFGIYRLGESEADPLEPEILAQIAQPFAHNSPWNDATLSRDADGYYAWSVMAGAMPIADLGDAIECWLVVGGPQRGQIWLDKRTDGDGIAPVLDSGGQIAHFGAWYTEWLDSAFAAWGDL